MTKYFLLSLFLIFYLYPCTAQVGINTENPNSTLDVRGSLQTAFREVTSDIVLDDSDYYITYNGTADGTITLPSIATGDRSFKGRIYRIKNVAQKILTVKASGNNTIRASATAVPFFAVNPGCYIEVVNNGNTNENSATWDLSYISGPFYSSVSLYTTILKIPAYNTTITNHNSTQYDTGSGSDIWWLISNQSSSYAVNTNYINASKMTLVYEYQGSAFNTDQLYPMLTVGNSSSYPDVFTASFGGFSTVNGKTRLNVTVSRIDFIGATNASTTSNWGGDAFFLNALFTKKVQ